MSWELFKHKPWDALLVLMQSQYYLVYLYCLLSQAVSEFHHLFIMNLVLQFYMHPSEINRHLHLC